MKIGRFSNRRLTDLQPDTKRSTPDHLELDKYVEKREKKMRCLRAGL